MARVIVVGSANLDTAIGVEVHPKPGETVLGLSAESGAGGKGLNQAVAAARAGADTTFVGAVGADAAGERLRETMVDDGITPALAVSTQPTGAAYVTVAADGENSIVVIAGANADEAALEEQVTAGVADVGADDVVLAQLEVPLPVVAAAMRLAHRQGATTILNAAPSRALPEDLLADVSLLIVNEHECLDVASADEIGSALDALTARVDAVIVTLGADGAILASGSEHTSFAAHRVEVVDTTAAGDTFCGALAARLAAGVSIADALAYGTAAAAITVQRAGAVASIPRADEIDSDR